MEIEFNPEQAQRSIDIIERRPLRTFFGYEVPIWIGRCIDFLTPTIEGGIGLWHDKIMGERRFLFGERHAAGEIAQIVTDIQILHQLFAALALNPDTFILDGTHFDREKLQISGDNGTNPARFTHTFYRYRFETLLLPQVLIDQGHEGSYQVWVEGLEVADPGQNVPKFDVLARIHHERIQETLAKGINGQDSGEVFAIKDHLKRTAGQLVRTELEVISIMLAGGGERRRVGLEFTRYLFGAELALVWFPDRRKQTLGVFSGVKRANTLGEVEEAAAITRFSRLMMKKGSTKAKSDNQRRQS